MATNQLHVEISVKAVRAMTQKEKMTALMDDLLSVVHRISNNKDATPEEIAALPALANSIVYITGYAAIEAKDN